MRSRLAYEMIRRRECLDKIVEATGYTRNTVSAMVNRIWGVGAEYPGRKNGFPETLCWKCGKAVSRCSWSRYFVPVEGWDARETQIYSMTEKGDQYRIQSYFVRSCPEFEPDPPKGKK